MSHLGDRFRRQTTDESALTGDEMEATGNAPWHQHQPIEDLARQFKGRPWVPLEAAIAALQFWQRRDYEHSVATPPTTDASERMREALEALETAASALEYIGGTTAGCSSTHGDPGGGLEICNAKANEALWIVNAALAVLTPTNNEVSDEG